MKSLAKEEMVRVLSRHEVLDRMDRGENPQIVNVLDPKYHDLGLIKGSLKIPLSEIGLRASELDPSREVITYCAGYECNASREAAKELMRLGFTVFVYEGGIHEWRKAGFPIE